MVTEVVVILWERLLVPRFTVEMVAADYNKHNAPHVFMFMWTDCIHRVLLLVYRYMIAHLYRSLVQSELFEDATFCKKNVKFCKAIFWVCVHLPFNSKSCLKSLILWKTLQVQRLSDRDGNCVSATDGDGSQVLRGWMVRKTWFKGPDGDGYSLCGNRWGWVNFPLLCTVCSSLAYTDIRRGSLVRWCQMTVRLSKMLVFSFDRNIFHMKFPLASHIKIYTASRGSWWQHGSCQTMSLVTISFILTSFECCRFENRCFFIICTPCEPTKPMLRNPMQKRLAKMVCRPPQFKVWCIHIIKLMSGFCTTFNTPFTSKAHYTTDSQ